jgi:8-oxo-dGTP pyrophosphatase MutT (NUDIX family)
MSIGRFYAAIGALLWHPPSDKYLILKRSAEKDFGAGGWECVTGRVDQGEGFPEAVQREVYEELGVRVRVDFIVGTMHFYRGDPTPENELVGVVFCCSLDDRDGIRISHEHSEARWVTGEEVDALLPEGGWLNALVRRAEAIRSRTPAELLDFFRQEGFSV